MNRMSKRLVALVVFAVASLSIYVIYQWNKPGRNARQEEAAQLTAQQLMNAYRNNESKANTLYLDRTLAVQGKVLRTSTNATGQRIAELETAQPEATIFCTIAADENTAIATGQTLRLQGICKGYRDQMIAVDVVLQDCYVVP